MVVIIFAGDVLYQFFRLRVLKISLMTAVSIPLAMKPALAATEEEFDKFREAMIEAGCVFNNREEGQAIQKKLNMSGTKFSEIMLRLALNGEFICPAGCRLIHPDCPDRK